MAVWGAGNGDDPTGGASAAPKNYWFPESADQVPLKAWAEEQVRTDTRW